MIVNKPVRSRIEIDLTGPQGNAWVLLGYAVELSKKLDLDKDAILDEMKESDYEHLVQTFDKYFGAFVVMYR